MKKLKIAIILRTVGLEYDDRIRKECMTLLKKADVFIFAIHADNREEAGVTSYGAPYKFFKLKLRDILPSSKGLFLKSVEFYWRIKKSLSDYDLVWAHEEYAYLFPLLSKKNKCIWDLHEIPNYFEKPLLKQVFHYIEKKSKKIIHANEYRIRYLIKNKTIKRTEKHIAIRNFPDHIFLQSKLVDTRWPEFCAWLAGADYIYLQGLSTADRYPENILKAVLSIKDMKVIVVGEFDEALKSNLDYKYAGKLKESIYFAGLIKQLDIPTYLRKAQFTVILYNTDIPNNRYCEANRLYQAIVMGVPVIVGCNESMKDLVDNHNYGFALKNDGRDLCELESAIRIMIKNRDLYVKSIKLFKDNILWERQENRLFAVIMDQ